MKILVVIPVPREIAALRDDLVGRGFRAQDLVVGRLPVVLYPDLGITLAQGGLGKVEFAVRTQHLLDACTDWDCVVCAGAAGALIDDLSVGDVVVATETVEHDINNRFGKPLLPKFSGAETAIDGLRRASPGLDSFRVRFGPVASGDEDVVDAQRRGRLRERTGALAVAWEGAGGARACSFSGVPFVEIRGVTDRADSSAASDFRENLATAMGNVATLIVAWVEARPETL